MDYNLLLFGMASKASLFVSVQGGNSVVASLWNAPNFIYAVRGTKIARGTFHKWYGQLSGSMVRAFDYRDELVENIWNHEYCKQILGNGTIVLFIPKMKQLVERAVWEKGFTPAGHP